MRRVAHLASLTLLLAFSPALLTAAEGGAPQAVVPVPVVDLGDVVGSSNLTAVFEIRNQGTAPLEITQVRPACGCTVADYDRVIAPGASGKVSATLDTASLTGATAKAITVFTNDPGNPRLQLTLKSNVRRFLSAQPGYARFTSFIHKEAPQSSPQIVWADGTDDFQVVGVESPQRWIKVSYRPARDGERIAEATGHQWAIDVTLAAEAPVGPVAEMVRVSTNHPRQPEIEIPVSGFVRPIVAVTPPDVDFHEIDRTSHQAWGVLIRNFGSAPMTIRNVKSSVPGLGVEVEAIEAGERFRVLFTPSAEMAKGPFTGQVELMTDLADEPVIRIPVKGEVI